MRRIYIYIGLFLTCLTAPILLGSMFLPSPPEPSGAPAEIVAARSSASVEATADQLRPNQTLAIISQAAIETVSWAEVGWTPDSGEEVYRTMFGGALFESYAKHPDSVQKIKTKSGVIRSAAAGRFQFMPDTWNSLYSQYDYWPTGANGEEFIPLAQDIAMIRLYEKTGAFYHLEQGTSVLLHQVIVSPEAIAKSMNAAASTWCGLPSLTAEARGDCDDPRQSQKTMADTIAVFNESLVRNQALQLRASAKVPEVLAISENWVGKDFNPGALAQCAYFVREVFESAGMPLPASKDPFSSTDPRAGRYGPGMAVSLIGSDIGIVRRTASPVEIPAGSIIGFTNTYGDFEEGAITHVAVGIGDGEMIDRPTAAKPVQKRRIETFPADSSGMYTYVLPGGVYAR